MVICGPSHASPMQRCLFAQGVIVGCRGLFLCQRRPCQEMSDNRARQWLTRTAAAHVGSGRDEGMMGIHPHTSRSTAQALCCLANLLIKYNCILFALKQHRGSSLSYTVNILTWFVRLMSDCKMKMLIDKTSTGGRRYCLRKNQNFASYAVVFNLGLSIYSLSCHHLLQKLFSSYRVEGKGPKTFRNN